VFEKLKKGLNGIVERISKGELSDKDLEPILWDLQLQLISNDVALDVATKVCDELKERLKGVTFPRFGDKSAPVKEVLHEAIEATMTTNGGVDLLDLVAEKKAAGEPLVILFVGINGTGKTTTIAKIWPPETPTGQGPSSSWRSTRGGSAYVLLNTSMAPTPRR